MVFEFLASSPVWRSIDDGVMGGLSTCAMVIEDGVAVFRGVVSLANGGGFASVRSEPLWLDLSAFDGLILRVRGDGRHYTLRLRTTDAFDGVSYDSRFSTKPGEWESVAVPFAAFEPYYRGAHVDGYPPLVPSKIRSFGFMISGRQEGSFRLEIESIAGYPETR